MSEESKMILQMLRDGKINADEAVKLLNAATPRPERQRAQEGPLLDDLRDTAREVVARARREAKSAVRKANELLREGQDAKREVSEAARELRQELREQLREAKARFKDMKRETRSRWNDGDGDEVQRQQAEDELEQARAEVDELQEELDEIEDELDEAEDEADAAAEAAADRPERSVLGSVLSALGGGQTFRSRDEQSGKLPDVAIPRVSLRGVNGKITVAPSPDDHWHLTVEKSTRAANADEAQVLSRKLYSVETTAEGLSITAQKMFGQARSVNFALRLPSTVVCDLDLSTVNGSIRVEGGVANRLRASTTNGQVSVDSQALEISLASVNGRIELAGSAPIIQCRAVNGSLAINCPEVQAGSMELDTVNGNMAVQLGGAEEVGIKISAANVHGSVHAEGLGLKIDVTRQIIGKRLSAASEGKFAQWLNIEAKSVHGSIKIARIS